MNKVIILFISTVLALVSCNNPEPKTQTTSSTVSTPKPIVDPKAEFTKLNAFMKKYDEPSQTFTVPASKLIKVTGKKGTIIEINPADLETENGKPIGKTVVVELKELSNQSQLLRANAQTVSDGNLLVSAGAYFIGVTSDSQKVKLKEGKTYTVQFAKFSKDEMSLFYGTRDSLGNLNWKPVGQNLKTEKLKKDTVIEYKANIVNHLTRKDKNWDTSGMKKEYDKAMEAQNEEVKKSLKYYYPIEINQFGYINCDRLFKPNSPRTDIAITITNKKDSLDYIKVYLIFSDINSIMSTDYQNVGDYIEKSNFSNVPVGQKVQFLAVSYRNQKIYAVLTDIIPVTANLNEKLTLNEMTEETFDKLMSNLK